MDEKEFKYRIHILNDKDWLDYKVCCITEVEYQVFYACLALWLQFEYSLDLDLDLDVCRFLPICY